MFRIVKKYFRLNKLERKILISIFFWLVYSFILVRFIPLRWFNHILGEYNKEFNIEPDEQKRDIIRLIQKNIRRCKKVLPWNVKCFEEAIAAKKMLEKQNVKTTLYLGVDKELEKKLIAHAWLKTGNKIITGSKGHKKYAVVGFYS